jgi:hypothetical protein
MKDPQLVNDVLTKEDYDRLLLAVANPKSFEYFAGFSRYCVADNGLPILKELADKLVPKAREAFDSKELLPTYILFAHYEGQDPEPSLFKHKDDNACTYTLDMCVYQNESWDLFVEDKAYTLYPNQALAYYGNDQMHWREKFPNPETNHVAMVFFHFAEPDHWWFTKGPEYHQVITGQMTEQDFDKISSTRS